MLNFFTFSIFAGLLLSLAALRALALRPRRTNALRSASLLDSLVALRSAPLLRDSAH